MGVTIIRKDSVKEKRTEKTRAQLQAENEELRARVEALEGQTGPSGEAAQALDVLLGEVSGDA